ncbi:MAG: inositol monophosphatase family protein [Bradymonadales bacterium]|jgi:myo-inositol-1(or 4)-monophosphatase
MNYAHYLELACEAAHRAGENIKRLWNVEREISIKSDESLLTQIDTENERLLVDYFQKHSSDIAFLGEETGAHALKNSQEAYWCVDPVDGTTNLAHRFDFVCVSIALVVEGSPKVGVVYNPMQNQLFHAAQDLGAKLNNKPIRVSQESDFKRSLLATGFPVGPFASGTRIPNMKNFQRISMHCHSVRRPGSAALDLACVAAGFFDGFWEIGLKAWDTPAGTVLVREAGGVVTGFEGDDYDLHNPYIIASNGHIHEELQSYIKKSD